MVHARCAAMREPPVQRAARSGQTRVQEPAGPACSLRASGRADSAIWSTEGPARDMTAPKTRKPRRPAGARGQPAGSKGRPAARQAPTPEGPAADQSGPGCAEGAGLQVLGPVVTATCWLEPGDGGQPYRAAVSFSGRRTGMSGKPRQGDRFERVETIGPVVAGSGPVSVTVTVSASRRASGSSGPGRLSARIRASRSGRCPRRRRPGR